MAAEKIETPSAMAGAGSMPAPTPEDVRSLGLRIAELDAEIVADRRDIVHWYRETVDGADAKSEEEIHSMFEQAEHKGATDIPLKRAKAYIEAFAKKSAQRKALTEALATDTVAATEAESARAACELRALVPGYEPLDPAARALVTGAVTDKALSVLLDDTANLRVLGEVGARVMAVVRDSEERAAKRLVESEERAAERLAESEERMLKHLAASEARTAVLLKSVLEGTRESEARTVALLEVALGGPFAALMGSAFIARMTGVPAATLRRKYSAYDMKVAGFTAAEVKAAGFTAAEVKAAGFDTAVELKAAGFTAAEVKAAGFDTAVELKAAGFTAAEVKAAGFTAAELKAAGFERFELRVVGARCICFFGPCEHHFNAGAMSWSA